MKKVLYLLAILMILPTILAIDLEVNQTSQNEALIIGLGQPAVFKINVTNNGKTDDFKFYTFFGLGFDSNKKIRIESGETKEIVLKVYPRYDFNLEGFTTFSYFIQDRYGDEIEEKFTVKIVELSDAFEVGASSINPESNSLEIYIHNKVNFNFEDLEVKFSSAFFELEKELDLAPYKRATFEVDLKKDEFDELIAGFYTLSSTIKVENLSANVEGKIEFTEKNLLETNKRNYGFIIFTKVIQTKNEGNVMGEAEVTLERNAITRLFTTMKPEPTNVEREGMTIYYTWNKNLAPGEIHEVVFRTNWFYPLLAIFLVVLIIYFTKKYSRTDLVLRKKVNFVNAKGGEFALKVTVLVEAKEYLEKVRIVDRLPPLVRVYGRFGGEIPARFHKTNKVFEWDFEQLEAGEKRVLSYIIYSKVGVLGKFALPSARGIFRREGIEKEVTSNRAYFLAQQKDNLDLD